VSLALVQNELTTNALDRFDVDRKKCLDVDDMLVAQLPRCAIASLSIMTNLC